MNHASLFSGIGGAEVAAARLGWHNIFHCEINPFGRKVIEYHFPNSVSYDDITKTDFSEWRGKIDILTGGFPCQPFSLAGERRGDTDDRYLFPHMLRAIHEIHPTWIVGENVSGITSMVQSGSVVEVASGGTFFEENHTLRAEQRFTLDEICESIEREGYSVQPIVIPACAVGAPHRRDRVWIVAHAESGGGTQSHGSHTDAQPKERSEQTQRTARPSAISQSVAKSHGNGLSQHDEYRQPEQGQAPLSYIFAPTSPGTAQTLIHPDNARCAREHSASRDDEQGRNRPQQRPTQHKIPNADGANPTAHPESERRGRLRNESQAQGTHASDELFGEQYPVPNWDEFPTQPPVCGGDDGLPAFVDDLTISYGKWRTETIKAYGNAWVVAVAEEIFKAIEEIDAKL